MKILERFLQYTSFDTQSAEDRDCTPSTEKQWRLAEHLKAELTQLGLTEIELDAKGYLYATLPATPGCEHVPTVGFIAHMDTSPDASGQGVKPRIVEKYDGTDILLNAERGIVSAVKTFPELLDHCGEDLVVTDGLTLLGADDKAGIAEIVTACEHFLAHPEEPHGKVRIAFNPDEEIGLGARDFDVEKFAAQFAYTMDGGEKGELEFENFNAASARIEVEGVSVHPGYAKGKMVNAARLAAEFQSLMPAAEVPETTDGYEGFYHLIHLEGTVEKASLTYIIRDHDRARFEERKKFVARTAEYLQAAHPTAVVRCEIRDQYYNMRERIEPVMHVIEIAQEAMRRAGVEPHVKAIRGGTDGAQLSFKGLPCPNIFAGGLNFHGPHEFLPVPNLLAAERVVREIIKGVAERWSK